MTSTTLVLGIGNTLLSDEGIGIHVVKHLAAYYADIDNVSYLDGGTLSFTLAQPIAENDNLIVIDAARIGQPAGTVRCFVGTQMDHYLRGNRSSVHEVGLTDLLDIARLSGTFPEHRALIGVEPHSLDWGEIPSPQVAPAIEQAVAQVLALLRRWS